jgi:hypothetical protein
VGSTPQSQGTQRQGIRQNQRQGTQSLRIHQKQQHVAAAPVLGKIPQHGVCNLGIRYQLLGTALRVR